MVQIGPSLRVSERWTYALIGGIVSVPFTIGLYWLSGTGSEFSLNMVFFGGILAGYLASAPSPETDCTSVGFRAGAIGGLPGLWLLVDLVEAAIVWSPLWFRIVVVSMLTIVFTTLLLGLSGLVGLLGGKVGGWLATKTGRRRAPIARN
jgi:cell shape-determining protein MreD